MQYMQCMYSKATSTIDANDTRKVTKSEYDQYMHKDRRSGVVSPHLLNSLPSFLQLDSSREELNDYLSWWTTTNQ